MKKQAKYFWVKFAGAFLIVLLAVVLFFNQLVPFRILNEKAIDLPYKAFNFQDKTIVYLPYQIKIANNRLLILNFERIYDESISEENLLDHNLVFTESGRKIDRFVKDPKNDSKIFPFQRKTFYYYKRHIITKNNTMDQIDYISAIAQLNVLKSDGNIVLSSVLVDSLYQSDNGKRFNVHFGDSSVSSTKYAKAKINSEQQLRVIIADSLKGKSKEEAQEYLFKVANSHIGQQLKDF